MTRRPTAALGFAAACLLAGCSVGPTYHRPATAIPKAWTNAAATGSWPSAHWWKSFGSARLDTLMAEAHAANFDVAAAIARVRQADAQLRVAGAALLPSLNASAGASRQRSSMSSGPDHAILSRAPLTNSFSLDLTASYELDFWGANRALERAAKAQAAASRDDLLTTRLTVQASVANTYFDLLGQAERLRVARSTVANARQVLAIVRNRFRVGTATDLDVAQQESVVAAQEATLPPLEEKLRQDVNALAVLVGRMPESMPADLAGKPDSLGAIHVPEVRPGLPSHLLARRPDVRSAEQQLIAANADIDNARAQFFPAISLTTQGGLASAALDTLISHTGLVYSFGTSVLQTIFDGGKLSGQLEQQKGRYQELLADYRKSVVSAFSDVENALIAVGRTRALVQAERVNVATSLKAYRISRDQFRAGIVDITSVLTTQKALYAAQDALAQAQVSRLQAVVGLYQALGGGWGNLPPAAKAG